MQEYNKFKSGEFKRNFKPMTKADRLRMIKVDFADCDCDSANSNLNKKGIALLKSEIIKIEKVAGVKRLIYHKAITQHPLFK